MSEQGPTVNAALISRMGKEAGEVVKHVDTILAAVGLTAPSNGPDKGGLRRIPLPLPVGVFYGAVDGDFVVTIGEYTASVLTPYLRGEGAALASSESLTRARAKFGGNDETRAISVYVDIDTIKKRVEKLMPMFTGGDPDALAAYAGFMEHTGYGLIKSFCWEMHHREGGCYNGYYAHTGEKPTGALGILANKEITDKELALIPLGVNWAMAFRMGSEKWFDQMLAYVATASPMGEAEILGGVAFAEEMLGFRLGGDFLDLINDAVIVYDAPEDGGLLITGMTVIFKASDTNRFLQSVKRIANLISEQVSDGNVAMKISGFTHRGHKIEFVNMTGVPMPVAPAWSTHEGWIILGLYPQIVRNAIDRNRFGRSHHLGDGGIRERYGCSAAPCETARSLEDVLTCGQEQDTVDGVQPRDVEFAKACHGTIERLLRKRCRHVDEEARPW